MRLLREKLSGRAALVRVLPFLIFVALTAVQGKLGESSSYWIYLAKTIVGAWMIWVVWPLVREMRWRFSWAAVLVGIGVFVIWVGLDGLYPPLDELLRKVGLSRSEPGEQLRWNPHDAFGTGSTLAWTFILVRILGSSLVVPHLEEVFYRSFLYRWIIKPDFEKVELGRFDWKAFLIVSIVFGFAHFEWLAGILCGFAYQGLVVWKKRLGDAMTAHAITNFLLGLWVVWKGAWHFW
jgi:uncharacterized protein